MDLLVLTPAPANESPGHFEVIDLGGLLEKVLAAPMNYAFALTPAELPEVYKYMRLIRTCSDAELKQMMAKVGTDNIAFYVALCMSGPVYLESMADYNIGFLLPGIVFYLKKDAPEEKHDRCLLILQAYKNYRAVLDGMAKNALSN